MLLWGQRGRDKGRLVPRWQLAATACVPGHLLLDEKRIPELGRTVRVAVFANPLNLSHTLWPALHDVQLLKVQPEWLVLSGFEHEGIGEIDVAQTWLLHTSDPDRRSAPETPQPRAAKPLVLA